VSCCVLCACEVCAVNEMRCLNVNIYILGANCMLGKSALLEPNCTFAIVAILLLLSLLGFLFICKLKNHLMWSICSDSLASLEAEIKTDESHQWKKGQMNFKSEQECYDFRDLIFFKLSYSGKGDIILGNMEV